MAKNMMKQLKRRKKRAEARNEAKELVLEVNEEFLTKVDVTILYTLHTSKLRLGKKRIEEFYLDMINNQFEMIKQFRTSADDDETYYLVMADRLKKAGIDVAELQAKADQIKMPECDYEERQKMIKELLNNG